MAQREGEVALRLTRAAGEVVWLDAGVTRVILGTKALRDPPFVVEACKRWPGRIVVEHFDPLDLPERLRRHILGRTGRLLLLGFILSNLYWFTSFASGDWRLFGVLQRIQLFLAEPHRLAATQLPVS